MKSKDQTTGNGLERMNTNRNESQIDQAATTDIYNKSQNNCFEDTGNFLDANRQATISRSGNLRSSQNVANNEELKCLKLYTSRSISP